MLRPFTSLACIAFDRLLSPITGGLVRAGCHDKVEQFTPLNLDSKNGSWVGLSHLSSIASRCLSADSSKALTVFLNEI